MTLVPVDFEKLCRASNQEKIRSPSTPSFPASPLSSGPLLKGCFVAQEVVMPVSLHRLFCFLEVVMRRPCLERFPRPGSMQLNLLDCLSWGPTCGGLELPASPSLSASECGTPMMGKSARRVITASDVTIHIILHINVSITWLRWQQQMRIPMLDATSRWVCR